MVDKEAKVVMMDEADVSRRDIAALVLGALGASALAGCANGAGATPEQSAATVSPIVGSSFLWFDRISGATIPDAVTLDQTAGSGTNQVALAQGYWAAGDGGGGLFYWSSDLLTNDDRGTVIVPNVTPRTGCWKRLFSGALNVKWFGARGDGSPDWAAPNVAAFNATINAKEARGGGAVYVPGPGTYALGSALDLGAKGVLFYGDLANDAVPGQGSTLVFTSGSDGIVFSASTCQSTIRDLVVVGATARTGTGIRCTAGFSSGTALAISNVAISSFGTGFNPGYIEDNSITDLRISNCVTGVVCDGIPNNVKFFNLWVQSCTHAIKISQGASIFFYGGLIQANGDGVTLAPAVGVGGINGIHFDGVWFEAQGSTPTATVNTGPDVVFDTTNGVIHTATFRRCRMYADTTALAFSGSGANPLINLRVLDCFTAWQVSSPPPWWVTGAVFDLENPWVPNDTGVAVVNGIPSPPGASSGCASVTTTDAALHVAAAVQLAPGNTLFSLTVVAQDSIGSHYGSWSFRDAYVVATAGSSTTITEYGGLTTEEARQDAANVLSVVMSPSPAVGAGVGVVVQVRNASGNATNWRLYWSQVRR